MRTVNAFINRDPVVTYFILTFVISWGGVLLIIGGPGKIPGTADQFEKLLPVAILAMLAGPIAASMLLTGLVYGRAGFREFLSRLIKWRVSIRWYGVSLLTAPILFMAILLGLSLFSPAFLPNIFTSNDKASVLLAGIATGLAAGIFEELGWTGFAVPTLRRRYGVFTTGLIVGLMWAAWHLLVTYWASGTYPGGLTLVSYLLDPFLFLTLYRMLMVWVYDRTGSLPVAILMHMSLTASSRIFVPPGIAGVPLLTFDIVWAAVLCIVVVAVAFAMRRRSSL